MLLAHFLISVVGLYEFTAAHGLKASPTADVSRLAIAWIPYQLVLAYAAGRAVSTPDARHQQLGENRARGCSPWALQRRRPKNVKEMIDDAA